MQSMPIAALTAGLDFDQYICAKSKVPDFDMRKSDFRQHRHPANTRIQYVDPD